MQVQNDVNLYNLYQNPIHILYVYNLIHKWNFKKALIEDSYNFVYNFNYPHRCSEYFQMVIGLIPYHSSYCERRNNNWRKSTLPKQSEIERKAEETRLRKQAIEFALKEGERKQKIGGEPYVFSRHFI